MYELDLLRLEPPLLPPPLDFSLPLPLEEEDLVLLGVAEGSGVSGWVFLAEGMKGGLLWEYVEEELVMVALGWWWLGVLGD